MCLCSVLVKVHELVLKTNAENMRGEKTNTKIFFLCKVLRNVFHPYLIFAASLTLTLLLRLFAN